MPEKTFERRVYPISIDFAEWEREIPPLCGVNGCPLDTVGYQPNRSIPLDLRMDFEEFYSEIGVTSIRTHHDGFNTANIFGTKTKQHCCIYGLDTDFLTDSLILSSSIPRIPPFCNLDDETEQNANPQVILDYFVDLPEQPDRTNVWLFWRPYEDEIDDEDNYEYAKNGCRDAYQQMIENNYEICFRVGENNSGPTFINGPQNPVGSIGSAPDDSDAMMAYARVAKNIISHLSFPTEKTLLDYRPDFIELWNESESNKFTGPEYIAGDDRTPESAEAQALFILEFSLCIYQQVQHVGSRIGGFCFASESMKDFAETIETHSNEGHSLTEPRDYLAMSRMYWMLYYWFRFSSGNLWEPDYISFHWYGSILKEEDGTSGDEVNQTIGDWAADLERGCETLNDVADAFNQELPPIQITEWNYAVPRKAPKKCKGSFGSAAVSAGMTFLHVPRLGIERAHLWLGQGYGNANLFSKSDWEDVESGDSVAYFEIRPAAAAFSLYKGLEDWFWVPVGFCPPRDMLVPYSSYTDVIEAAKNGYPVAVFAARSDTEEEPNSVVVIITNLNEAGDSYVHLELKGLAAGCAYRVEEKSTKTRYEETKTILAFPDENEIYVPDENKVEEAIEYYLNSRIDYISTNELGQAQMMLYLRPLQVVKLLISDHPTTASPTLTTTPY